MFRNKIKMFDLQNLLVEPRYHSVDTVELILSLNTRHPPYVVSSKITTSHITT
jgi:hypothetical protein